MSDTAVNPDSETRPAMRRKSGEPQKSPTHGVHIAPFLAGFVAVMSYVLLAVVFPEKFEAIIVRVQNAILTSFGWSYVFVSFLMILFALAVIVSPIGSIRIGGPEAKPAFGIRKWFAISLCSGIGIGIMFWGIGEPIYHFMQPPGNLNIEPGSHEASLFAISQSILHWSIAQYCIYALCAVAFALAAFNEKRPLSVMSALEPIVSHERAPMATNLVHASCLFCICGAVISSTASLIMQSASSISYLFGLDRSFLVHACVTIFATVFFVASSTTGLKKGMSFLSTWNTRLFFVILAFCFCVGPTVYILNMGSEAFGYMMSNFCWHSTLTSTPFLKDRWPDSWIAFYMAWFFAYGVPIGLYLARLGKGRTVRQFLLMNILAPTVFVYFWINTFGSTAIYKQLSGAFDVWQYVNAKGIESTVIAILQGYPLAGLLIAVFIIVMIISFVTLVDPMTTVLATLSTKGISAEDEAPKSLKIIWGAVIGAGALAVVTLGGVASLRAVVVFSGLLILFITLFICYCLLKMGRRILAHENAADAGAV